MPGSEAGMKSGGDTVEFCEKLVSQVFHSQPPKGWQELRCWQASLVSRSMSIQTEGFQSLSFAGFRIEENPGGNALAAMKGGTGLDLGAKPSTSGGTYRMITGLRWESLSSSRSIPSWLLRRGCSMHNRERR